MKTITSIILAAFIALGQVPAHAENTDTITTIIGAKSVIITESPKGMSAVVNCDSVSKKFEQNYSGERTVSLFSSYGLSLSGNKARKKSSVSWYVRSGGLGLGFCSAPRAPASAGIEMGKSFELSWMNILSILARNKYGNTFTLGIGINWRNYRTTLDNRFIVNDGKVEIGSYPEGVEPRLSRIKIFSLQFPLLYRQKFPFGITKEKLSMSFGPIFNFNTHASVLASWHDGETKSEYKVDGINARPFTIDMFAAVHFWKYGSFYVRYSPYNALTGHHQLNFHQFSTGVMLFL